MEGTKTGSDGRKEEITGDKETQIQFDDWIHIAECASSAVIINANCIVIKHRCTFVVLQGGIR